MQFLLFLHSRDVTGDKIARSASQIGSSWQKFRRDRYNEAIVAVENGSFTHPQSAMNAYSNSSGRLHDWRDEEIRIGKIARVEIHRNPTASDPIHTVRRTESRLVDPLTGARYSPSARSSLPAFC